MVGGVMSDGECMGWGARVPFLLSEMLVAVGWWVGTAVAERPAFEAEMGAAEAAPKLPAILVLGLWFVLQVFTQSSSGIATLAHIGGFVFGVLVAVALAQAAGFPRRRAPDAQGY